MEYTTNYHLPQWVETDRIQMEDFNAAMASIDAGMQTIKENADTAGRTASTGAGKISSLETRVTAMEQDMKFVKLAGPTSIMATGQDLTFNLSGIDMSKYAALILLTQGAASNGLPIALNNVTVATVLNCGGGMNGTDMTWLQPAGNTVFSYSTCFNGEAGYPTTSQKSGNCTWANITSMKVGGAAAYSGLKCILYGIKA